MGFGEDAVKVLAEAFLNENVGFVNAEEERHEAGVDGGEGRTGETIFSLELVVELSKNVLPGKAGRLPRLDETATLFGESTVRRGR